MASTFKKHWYLAAAGLSGAALLGLTVLLNAPAPEQKAPAPDDSVTEPETPLAPQPAPEEHKEPEEQPAPETNPQTMNAADECITDAVENLIVPSYEVKAGELRAAQEHGLHINPDHAVKRLQAITAHEFAECAARTEMEPTDASAPARAEVETTKQNFITEFTPN